MNPILEKWLAERQAEEKKTREMFLIKQGLVDPSKTRTVFKDVYGKILTDEEAEIKRDNGLRVEKSEIYDALDLTEEEYNIVLAYAHPQTEKGELTDHELLRKILRHTEIISTILIISVILSVILGIIIGVNLGSF